VTDRIELFPVPDIPEIRKHDDIAETILQAARTRGIEFRDGDVVVVAQKIISKAEGRVFTKSEIQPSRFAEQVSSYTGHEPEYVELVLRNSSRIIRMSKHILISKTHHGFSMANAGVDSSNSGGEERMVTLPKDPDASAAEIRDKIQQATGGQVAVIVSDTFGRPWRLGHVNMAIGIAGLRPFIDYRGKRDNDGREMTATQIAVADELCSAAELVSGKTKRFPVVIVRNCAFEAGEGSARELVRDDAHDIFT
jgi:coenzyme F420-0:L-glutamate ligase/coenzyme F420-1:gamma-L-glutamate ligase